MQTYVREIKREKGYMMYEVLAEDKNIQGEILQEVLSETVEFLSHVEEGVVAPEFEEYQMQSLPYDGMGTERVLEFFMENYKDAVIKSAGPRYFGFVTGGATPAALAGDWLTSVYDQDAFGIRGNLDYHIETEAVSLIRELVGLSEEYFGTFVSGATMSNFVGLSLARQWAAQRMGVDAAGEGLYKLSVIKVASACAHSSVHKALSMLGIGRNSLIKIETLPDREAINITSLENYLKNNRDVPVIVVANLGTVNTGDFDDLESVIKLKEKYNFWLHGDAAFAGIAACSEKYKHLFKGMEGVDSLTIDTHKWLNTPYDGAVQFSRHKHLQQEVFSNSASYLDEMTETPSIFNLTPENSRRLRALPAWFTLMAYGKKGYQDIVEGNCLIAREFGKRIASSGCFKLLAEVKLNIVCFTLNLEGNKLTHKAINHFIEELRRDGKTFLTSTDYKGIPAARIAVSNWRTVMEDVDSAWQSMLNCAELIIKNS